MDSQQLKKIMDLQVTIVEDVRKDKQKLIQVILEKTDAKSLIRNIRRFLLELWVEDRAENSVDPSLYVSEAILLTADELEQLTETMKDTFKPAVEFKKQLLAIADVIRSSELSDEEKIDRITDILI